MNTFPLRRLEGEVRELRRMCEIWRAPGATGSEKFWELRDVLLALSMPSSLAFFAAATATAPWQGVLLADCGPDACDLLYVFVPPAFRRAGVAKLLIDRLVATLEERDDVEALLLEVRVANVAAQKLYESMGFARISARKRYYADGEDALVYKMELHAKAP